MMTFSGDGKSLLVPVPFHHAGARIAGATVRRDPSVANQQCSIASALLDEPLFFRSFFSRRPQIFK